MILLVSISALLIQFIRATDLHEVKRALQKAGSGFVLIIISTLTAYWFGAVGWWYTLGDYKKNISITRLFLVRHVCETVGLFNPASVAGGDMLKVVMLKDYQVPQQPALTSVVISRFLMIASQLMLLVFTLIWLVFSQKMTGFISGKYIAAIVLVLLILAFVGFYWVKKGEKELVAQVIEENEKPSKLKWVRNKINALRAQVYLFFTQNPKALLLSFGFVTLHWLVGSFEFYLILNILGYDVTVMHGLLLDMGVIVVKSAGAFVPGQIGVEELGNKLMLTVIGIGSASLWLSVSALRRTRQLFWLLMGALMYLLFVRRKKAYL